MAILSFFTKTELPADYPRLDTNLSEEPPSALAQALLVSDDIIKDILSLAAFVCHMPTNYQKGSGKVLKAENISNDINKKLELLNKYLRTISLCPLSSSDSYAVEQLLQSIDELSKITEHLTHIARVSKTISRLKSPLSFPAQKELTELWGRIDTILKTLDEAFLKGNSITSMWMLRQNSIIQEQITDFKKNHIKRLRSGKCNIETGMCFLDLLHDYGQIASHCTSLFSETFIMDTLEERKG